MKIIMKSFEKIKKYLIWLAYFIIVLTIFGIGYIYSGIKFAPPHYHTNFALFVDGEKINFNHDKYSEDIAKCAIGDEVAPKDRVHLHENNGDTIHIHNDGVSWGHFFANNGFYFSDTEIIFDSGKKLNINNGNKITFILNGNKVKNPYNWLVNSEDKLLINYGSQSEDIIVKKIYPKVSSDAGEYNNKYDPGTCSGTNENSTWFLIKQLLHLN